MSRFRVYISGVTKCVTKFLTLSQRGGFDSVKNFVTHFVTPEIWILTLQTIIIFIRILKILYKIFEEILSKKSNLANLKPCGWIEVKMKSGQFYLKI